jgi:hypothetical protein
MKASTLIRQRRALGNWLAYALPDDHDDDRRRPEPERPPPWHDCPGPPEKKEAGPPSPAVPGEPTPTAKPTTTTN